jgi:hypothetical protein
LNYLKAVLSAKMMSMKENDDNSKIKSLQKKIRSLYEVKNDYVKEILILKSAFSIIDEMFIKEMENAEIKKKYWLCAREQSPVLNDCCRGSPTYVLQNSDEKVNTADRNDAWNIGDVCNNGKPRAWLDQV